MRKTGIDDKMVFFVRRFPEPEVGSYFHYSVDKVICNPSAAIKFYLKIGAVTHLPKKGVTGKRNKLSAETLKDSKYFGSYLYYGETDKKIRCILYARRKGLPESKLVGQPSCLHSVIPRYDGIHRDRVISTMKVIKSETSGRQWSRYDVKTKQHHQGFYEIGDDQDLDELVFVDDNENGMNVRTGIYVGANTSAIMVDSTRAHLYLDYTRNFVYTLFQEGAFICTNRSFTFCFYDEEEEDEYDFLRLDREMRHKFEGTPNLDLLFRPGERHCILFLKSAPNYTLWTIRANRVRRTHTPELMLCVPSGGQLENVYNWDEGIAEVKRRQALKPWTKYTEQLLTDPPQLEEIDLDKDEVYPRMNSE